MSIYSDMVKAGQEIDNNESDLYVKDTPKAREILAQHGKKVDGWNVQLFNDQIAGARWLDLPFQYEPFWRARG